MSEIKYMDPADFRSLGFLQEVNRRFLHPCGLALSVSVDEDGMVTLGGIWDYREDPEGITFGDLGAEGLEHAQRIDAEIAKHADTRVSIFGAVVQPVDFADTA